MYPKSRFQSTHSRGVRHSPTLAVNATFLVSIHALTRSATSACSCLSLASGVSIHALTRSATFLLQTNRLLDISFNPRTHEECDMGGSCRQPYRRGFNPRTHEECDTAGGVAVGFCVRFNPRTHEECDSYERVNRAWVASFNPRTHEECDLLFRISFSG